MQAWIGSVSVPGVSRPTERRNTNRHESHESSRMGDRGVTTLPLHSCRFVFLPPGAGELRPGSELNPKKTRPVRGPEGRRTGRVFSVDSVPAAATAPAGRGSAG